ncbi:Protein WVD2-like 7 [Quillaja saponaria]|uniref:Protein WVD2-like 7 n=1 Tax=Quillaja saponaria TaxID=32244 RepID=A0AAD7VP60_QUISA|nr:Protein WVD2-like 7 [Quillaja saponaria]
MATDTDNHYHYSWSYPDIQSDHQHPEDVSTSEILDHGSISFGRFAAESLAWERRSAFSHNRCQEELDKFRAPGLVAQKKAYFEEFFKKARAMKTLQAEQQETSQCQPCQDARSNTPQAESSIDLVVLKEEKNSENACQTQISEDHLTDKNASRSGILCVPEGLNKQISYHDNNSLRAIEADETSLSSYANESEYFPVEASSLTTPLVSRSSEDAKQGCLISNSVKIKPSSAMAHTTILSAKGDVSSAGNKKLDLRIIKDSPKSNGRLKPSNHKHPKVSSSSTVRSVSVARDSPASSSPSCGGGTQKVTSTVKGWQGKLPKKLPDHAKPMQRKMEATVTSGLRNNAQDNRNRLQVSRKHLNMNDCQMRLKGGESESQRPKAASRKLPLQNNRVKSGGWSSVDGAKQKEGGKESNARPGKDAQSRQSTKSTICKTLNSKLGEKVALSRPGDVTHAQREPRLKMPSWR